jgi:hypothetical protein
MDPKIAATIEAANRFYREVEAPDPSDMAHLFYLVATNDAEAIVSLIEMMNDEEMCEEDDRINGEE